jgi:hypothetical protein
VSDEFPIADMIAEAPGHGQRAAMLLRVSDAVMFEDHGALKRACERSGFAAGATFLDARIAALCATRGPAGHLPDTETARLEQARRKLFDLTRSDR